MMTILLCSCQNFQIVSSKIEITEVSELKLGESIQIEVKLTSLEGDIVFESSN